jgi:hypothetical protein
MDTGTNRYVTLPRGRRLSWQDARRVVDAYLKDHSAALDLYDGTNAGPHDDVSAVDLLALNALNAYVGTAPMTPMEALWKNSATIRPFVAEITKDPLEDLTDQAMSAQVPKIAAALLEIEKSRGFGGGGTRAAKLLHRLRPNVVPIWDALVGEWYEGSAQPWREYLPAVFSSVRMPENLAFLRSIVVPPPYNLGILRRWDMLLWKLKYEDRKAARC